MSKLPNRKNAYIATDKIEKYLLSETHSVGQSKAKFFRLLGYNETNFETLITELVAIANTEEVKEIFASAHGVKYVINGRLLTPSGQLANVKTIWIIEKNHSQPRFVTAYPTRI
jgi:hypothetical protein